FSSFDGGGPEYSFELDDPELVSFTGIRQYDHPDHDMMAGSGYRVIYTFTGLKPGKTVLTVRARSPIAENYDARYAVTVDEMLNVTLTETEMIDHFSLSWGGAAYEITKRESGYVFSRDGSIDQPIDTETVDALYQIIEEDIAPRWSTLFLDAEGEETFSFRLDFVTGGFLWHDGAVTEEWSQALARALELLESIEILPQDDPADGFLSFLSGLLSGKRALLVGTDIEKGQVTEFWYTYSEINYPAFYQRFRFYVEDGAYHFFYETRQKDDYGPLTEKDVTETGLITLTDAQWDTLWSFLFDGTVVKRGEATETGDAGPWLYLYWTGDKGEYQEFSFASRQQREAFEAFCEALKGGR
ncbi:MAG: hypothetical protein IJS53_05405, partial [Clostridia bacterium]|nr:hypothetical protein [Clostridia bacterium]